MPLVASPIPNLVGGMTQQPASMRLNTMCEYMENCWPSVVSGLQKRPPSRHVKDLGVSLSAGAVGHLIERDPTYRYIVVVENGNLRVINLDTGALQSVTFPNGSRWKLQGEWSNAAYTTGTGYPNSSGQRGCLDGH